MAGQWETALAASRIHPGSGMWETRIASQRVKLGWDAQRRQSKPARNYTLQSLAGRARCDRLGDGTTLNRPSISKVSSLRVSGSSSIVQQIRSAAHDPSPDTAKGRRRPFSP
jgi:hypothetical protein